MAVYGNRNSQGDRRGGPAQRPQGNGNASADLLGPETQHIKGLNKLADLSAERIISIGQNFGREAARTLATRKLRKIHGQIVLHVTRARSGKSSPAEVQLIKYHLAYAVGRCGNREKDLFRPLAGLLGAASEKVKDRDDLERLRQLSESLIAFHRYHGGRD
ncbi:MAG: type III-A CRISPR-associated protein Csm2 [Synergistaceae bacterium]|nr:type III-A CRISPR-associated protein Csm2 [Synergistaceae bacterium]